MVEFSFNRDLLRVKPPLTGTYEYSSTQRVLYSVEIKPNLPSLFKLSDVVITPAPIDFGRSSHQVTDSGHLLAAPRSISANKGGKFSLRITSNPDSIETLPLLQVLSKEVQPVNISDLVLIVVPHLLTDFLSFVDALEAVGLKPDQTFIVAIPYSLKEHVVIRLMHRGYKWIWLPKEYPFADDIDKAIQAASDFARSQNLKILVVEDGGYVVPRLHSSYPEIIPMVVGAVEQTANGIWAYQAIPKRKRKITVMNVAESDLKKRRESPHIGDAVCRNISSLLERDKVSVRDKQVLVVGFGSTGSSVAETLAGMGATVTIFEEKRARKKQAKDRGFKVENKLETAIKGKFLVVGCTGKTPIGLSSLLKADHQTYFINASSKRLEVNHTDLNNITKQIETVAEFVTRYHLVNGRDLTILANGHPVNFHGKSESVPDKELQFIYGLLFDSAIKVATMSDLPKGIVEISQEVQTHIETIHDSLVLP